MSSWMAFKWISTSSRFRNSSGYVFFNICSHIFMIFEVKLSSDFGHAETGSGAKKRVVLRREFFFAPNLKQSEKTVFEQKFAFSLVVFCSHAAIWLWFLLFFRFFGSIFLLNGFTNPFIIRCRSSFLFSQWKFFELYVRTCPAMFFYFVMIFVTTIWRHSHFLFIRLCNINWNECLTSFFALSGESFVHARDLNFWSHLTYLTQKWLPHFEIDFLL